MATFYTFDVFKDRYVLTSQTNNLNIYNCYRIFPVDLPVYKKGRKSRATYNIVEVTDKREGYNDASGMYMVEHKFLTKNVLRHIFHQDKNGDRTKNHSPWEKDILDLSLLDGLVITEYEWVYRDYNFHPYLAIRYEVYDEQYYIDHEQEIKEEIDGYHQYAMARLLDYQQKKEAKKETIFTKI